MELVAADGCTAIHVGLVCLDVSLDLGPHTAGTAAKRAETAHHCDDDQCRDQAIFDCSCPSLVNDEPAQNRSDSVQATLLWSTSTGCSYLERG